MFQLHVKKQCCAFVFLIGLALKYAIIFVGIESTVLNLRLLRKMLFSSFCMSTLPWEIFETQKEQFLLISCCHPDAIVF